MDREAETPEPTGPAEEAAASPTLTQRVLNPPFLGDLPAPDGYAHVRGDCGDTMEVFLDVRDGRIERARFDTLGCAYTVACGSMAMEMAEGRSLVEALRIDAKRIEDGLGGLPPSHQHCAELAAVTLKKAILDALRRGKDAWKKAYRSR